MSEQPTAYTGTFSGAQVHSLMVLAESNAQHLSQRIQRLRMALRRCLDWEEMTSAAYVKRYGDDPPWFEARVTLAGDGEE